MIKRLAALSLTILLTFSLCNSFIASAADEEFSENFTVTEVNGKRAAVSVIV